MKQSAIFTEKTRDFCLYAGITGMIMSVISVFHFFMAIENFHWALSAIALPNICVFITCLFLAKLNRWVIVMLGICTGLFFAYFVVLLMLSQESVVIFSPSTLVLFVFTFSIFIYGLVTELHGKLKQNYDTLKADADYWSGKI